MGTGVIVAAAGAAGDEGLTAAIRREHEAASAAAGAAVAHAMEAGRLLAEARQGIAHGGWESFVRDRCGIAPRTARLYLQLDANRERLANRQRDAGLTVREAARLVAEPKVKAVPEAEPPGGGEPFDCLGKSWASFRRNGLTFNPDWLVVPFPVYAEIVAESWGVKAPEAPAWYAPQQRLYGHHAGGWCFEISPDHRDEQRVNAIVHDPAGTVHLATFDGITPAGIMPFLTACERHHGMPATGAGWMIESANEPPAITRNGDPFPVRVFTLATRPDHVCHCWALIDEAIGAKPLELDPFFAAWKKLGDLLGSLFGPGKPCGPFDDASMWWLGDFLNAPRRTARPGATA